MVTWHLILYISDPVFPFPQVPISSSGFMYEILCGSVLEFAGMDGEKSKPNLEHPLKLSHTDPSDPQVLKITSVAKFP